MDKLKLKDKISGSVYGYVLGDATFKQFSKVENVDSRKIVNDFKCDTTFNTDLMLCVTETILKFDGEDKPSIDDVDEGEFYRAILHDKKFLYIMGNNAFDCNSYYGVALACIIATRPELAMKISSRGCSLWFMRDVKRLSKALEFLYSGNTSEGVTKALEMASDVFKSPFDVTGPYDNGVDFTLDESFKSSMVKVLRSVNSSSRAALAGSIVGAKVGLSNLPFKMIKNVPSDKKELLGKFVNQMVDHRLQIV